MRKVLISFIKLIEIDINFMGIKMGQKYLAPFTVFLYRDVRITSNKLLEGQGQIKDRLLLQG